MSSSRAGPQLVHLRGRGEALANIEETGCHGGGAGKPGAVAGERRSQKAGREAGEGQEGRGPPREPRQGQRAGPPRAGRDPAGPGGGEAHHGRGCQGACPGPAPSGPGLCSPGRVGGAQLSKVPDSGSAEAAEAPGAVRRAGVCRRRLSTGGLSEGERPVNARRAGSRQKFQTGLEAPPRNASFSAPSPMQPIRGAQAAGAPPPTSLRARHRARCAGSSVLGLSLRRRDGSSAPARLEGATRCGVTAEGWRGVRACRWTSPTRFPGCGQTSRPQSRTHHPRLAGLVFETIKGAVCLRGASGGGPAGRDGKSLRPPGPSGVGRPGLAGSLLPA